MSDKEIELQGIISSCIEGSTRAQNILYRKYSGLVFSITFRYSKNRNDAEDLSQEIFSKIFRSLGSFRWDGSFDGWIRRIAVNFSINHYRKKLSEGYSVDVDSMWSIKDDSYERIAPDVTVEELEKILEKMPDGYAKCIRLYVLEGYKHKEIAEILGVDISTSKSQLSRGRSILLKIMETYFK
jgi:RNA polymerase sigma-70 factor (ECF subfamily)